MLYVEVVEVESPETAAVPAKCINTLRHTRSEECLEAAAAQPPLAASFSLYGNVDAENADCWSQEDDDISQQVRGRCLAERGVKGRHIAECRVKG